MSLLTRRLCLRFPQRIVQESLNVLFKNSENIHLMKCNQQVRCLFGEGFIKLKTHQKFTEDVLHQQTPMNKQKFMMLMEENFAHGGEVLSGDFRLMMAFTQTESEYNLLRKMVRRFAAKTKGQKYIYVVGPQLLRKLHLDGKPDMAIELFNDKVVNRLFDQYMSYMLMVDMLYENGRFKEAIDFIEDNFDCMKPAHQTRLSLAFKACCLKLAPDDDSYERMKKLDGSRQQKMVKKDAVLSIVMALNKNDLNYAKFIMDVHDSQTFSDYFAFVNCKALYFIRNKSIHLAVKELRNLHQSNCPGFIFKSVMDELLEAAANSGDQKFVDQADTVHKQYMYTHAILESCMEDYIVKSLSTGQTANRKPVRSVYPTVDTLLKARYSRSTEGTGSKNNQTLI